MWVRVCWAEAVHLVLRGFPPTALGGFLPRALGGFLASAAFGWCPLPGLRVVSLRPQPSGGVHPRALGGFLASAAQAPHLGRFQGFFPIPRKETRPAVDAGPALARSPQRCGGSDVASLRAVSTPGPWAVSLRPQPSGGVHLGPWAVSLRPQPKRRIWGRIRGSFASRARKPARRWTCGGRPEALVTPPVDNMAGGPQPVDK